MFCGRAGADPQTAGGSEQRRGDRLAGVEDPVGIQGPLDRAHHLHRRAAVLIHADRSRDYDLAGVVASVRGDCPGLRRAISLSDWDAWLAEGDPDAALPAVAPDAPAMLQYTSGTTGTPKGVLLRHRSLVNVAKLTMETAEADPGATGVNPLPMFHTAACVSGTLGPLGLGGFHIGVPKDDQFQVIGEHDAENFVFDPNYLDIRRTEDLVIIQITWNEGRTIEQKKALYKAIADGLADKLSLRREDVFVSLVEVKRENWSFGNGLAQYAT